MKKRLSGVRALFKDYKGDPFNSLGQERTSGLLYLSRMVRDPGGSEMKKSASISVDGTLELEANDTDEAQATQNVSVASPNAREACVEGDFQKERRFARALATLSDREDERAVMIQEGAIKVRLRSLSPLAYHGSTLASL